MMAQGGMGVGWPSEILALAHALIFKVVELLRTVDSNWVEVKKTLNIHHL